jgi:uncharacterized protein (UPF0332 family)
VRTSISRSYYASFLLAREKLGVKLKIPAVHQKVIQNLYEKDPVIANNLHSLRRLRNLSDYDIKITLRIADAEKALKLADFITNKLRAIGSRW